MTDRIEGFAGVLVWTSTERFPAMRAFYRDTLGLEPRSDRDGFISFAWGDRGDVRLSVSVHSGVDGPTREPLRLMLNLAVEDIEAVHARLEAAGLRFSRPPEREPWGGMIATFADPDGNTLQLLQAAPEVPGAGG